MKKKILLAIGALGLILTTVVIAHQDSTIISRLQLDFPDLGFEGGSALHDKVEAYVEKVGDNMSSRYEEFSSVADSTLSTHTHNFNIPFADLNVILWDGTGASKTRISDPSGSGWTIAANGGNPKTQIDITTPGAGGPHDFSVEVHSGLKDMSVQDSSSVSISGGDIDDVLLTDPDHDASAIFQEIASPASPAANKHKIYFKTDGKAYRKDENGVELELGAGGGGAGNKVNLVENNDFESNVTGWTASGSSTFTQETTNELFGTASGKWNPSATSETLTSTSETIPQGLYNQFCETSLTYNWSSGTAGDYTLQVYDGTNVLSELEFALTDSGGSSDIWISHACPSSGTLAVRIEVSANGATVGDLVIDKIWQGSNTRLFESSINTDWTAWTPTNTQGFGTISSVELEYKRVGDTMFIRGDFTCGTTASSEAQIELPDSLTVQAGASGSQLAGYLESNVQSSNNSIRVPILVTDGDTYLNFGTDVASSTDNQLTPQNGNNFLNTGNRSTIIAMVNIEEWAGGSQTAVSVDTQGMSWSGRHQSDCLWSRAVASYADPTGDATCTFSEDTNKNFGTVTSTADGTGNQPGITFTPRKIGKYFVCVDGVATTSQATWVAAFKLNSSQGGDLGHAAASTTDFEEFRICGIDEISTLSSTTIKIQFYGEGARTATIKGHGPTSVDAIKWTIFPLDQSFPQAIVLPQHKWQIKYLSADVTSDQASISDFAATLEVGKTYRFTLNAEASLVASGSNEFEISLKDGSTIFCGGTENAGNNNHNFYKTYSAIRTMVNSAFTVAWDERNDATLSGNGTVSESYLIIEELPYHEVTSQW